MRSYAPISFCRVQINTDYYQLHKTLKQVYAKWHMYSEEEIRDTLGIYDLSKEPGPRNGYEAFPADLRKEWDEVCRRINPKAWRKR